MRTAAFAFGTTLFLGSALLVAASSRTVRAGDEGAAEKALDVAFRSGETADRARALGALRGEGTRRALELLIWAASVVDEERRRSVAARARDDAELATLAAAEEKEERAFSRLSSPTGERVAAHVDAQAKGRVRRKAVDARLRAYGLSLRSGRALGREIVDTLVEEGRLWPPDEVEPNLDRVLGAWAAAPAASVETRLRGVEALTRLASPGAADRLRVLSRTDGLDPRVRIASLSARVRRGESRTDAGVLEDAVLLLDAEPWPLAAAAVDALRTLHRAEGIEPLIAFLGREGLGRLREDAHRALRSLTGESHGPYRQPWADWWAEAKGRFRMPARPASVAALVAPEHGVTFYGITTFSTRVLFVLDVSISMAEIERAPPASPRGSPPKTKIDAARRELDSAIDLLDDGSRFDVLLFSTTEVLWKPTPVRSERATRDAAKRFAAETPPHGDTDLHGALEAAFRMAGAPAEGVPYDPAIDTVFFLTDGRPTAGAVQDPDAILEAVRAWNATSFVTIHCVGLGASDPEFLRALSTSTGGRFVTR